MPPKRSLYVEANDLGPDGHPIDAEVERRTDNEDLKQRIMAAQEQLLGLGTVPSTLSRLLVKPPDANSASPVTGTLDGDIRA